MIDMWRKGQACEDFKSREEQVKGPGVKVSHTVKEAEGRPLCLEHRELGIQR